MKIGLDYIACIGTGGNAVYSRSIIEHVIAEDRNNIYYLYAYVHDVLRGRLKKLSAMKNVRVRPVYWSSLGLPIPASLVRISNNISYYLWTMVDRLDIFHFTNPLNFKSGRQKITITTIHDLSVFQNQTWSKEKSVKFFQSHIRDIVRKSDHLIAVSEYTKKDLVKTLGVDAIKITTIAEASSPDYFPDLDRKYLEEKYGLNEYLLYVGQLQPRKNILNILKAYSGLSDEARKKYPFVFVGGMRDKTYEREVNDIIEENKIGDHVKFFGQLPNNEVRKLYSGARAFVFPSLFEGFGLPVVESLKCGTPVITSNSSSLPEVAGDAGILADPESVENISNAMNSILINDGLYNELKAKCLKQAEKFSWKKAASETIRVYERAGRH